MRQLWGLWYAGPGVAEVVASLQERAVHASYSRYEAWKYASMSQVHALQLGPAVIA